MSFTDTDLIARVLLYEDQHAFGELVRRHQSSVRAFLTRMTRGDSHLADDLAQEAFLKGWQRLHTFRGNSRFSTWLFGIAFNEFRSAARQRKDLAWDDVADPPPEAAQPAADSISRLRLDLTEALKLLNSSERAAVVLCCQNGLSHEEAAQVLDCPLGTRENEHRAGKGKIETPVVPMNSPEQNDPLDVLLREQNPYLEDGGFTAHVIAVLPRRRRVWLRPALLLGATAVGAVLAARWLPWGDLPALDLSALFSSNPQQLLPWLPVLAVMTALVWSAVTALERQD